MANLLEFIMDLTCSVWNAVTQQDPVYPGLGLIEEHRPPQRPVKKPKRTHARIEHRFRPHPATPVLTHTDANGASIPSIPSIPALIHG